MSQLERSKKPTIKATNRAYVRLFESFASTESWLEFLEQYKVECVGFGYHRAGDCAVRVVDQITGDLAILGLQIPNHITYHTHAADRSFWNEHFMSETQRRHRTFEVGYPNALKDQLVNR